VIDSADRLLAQTPQSNEAHSSKVRFWIILTAVFAAFFVITLRAQLGVAPWFAQAVDLFAAPLTLLALILAGLFPKVGEIGLTLVARLAATRFPFLPIALAALVLSVLGAVVVTGLIPISADEIVPMFQARAFASFNVVTQFDPLVVNGAIPLVSQGVFVLVSPDGAALSVYFPGLALLVTPLVWLGVPWLIGPLFGALALYLIGQLGYVLVDRATGIIAMLLAVVSGQFLTTAMTPYPEGVHLALSAAWVWLMVQGRPRHFFVAGLIGGLALALKNPFPHFLFAIPWFAWLIADRDRRGNLLPLIAGYLPGILTIGAWAILQGNFAPPTVVDDGGFWISKIEQLIQLPSAHTVALRVVELVSAWSWSAPGLLVLAFIGWLRTDDVRLRLLGLSFGMTVVGYTFFPDQQGLGYGARYFHAAWVALPVLGAAALTGLRSQVLMRYAFAAALFALPLVLPFQLLYGYSLQERRLAPIEALAGPGVDLYFVNFRGREGVSESVLASDLSGAGDIVLVSQGPVRDQLVVDRFFSGAQLVTENRWGSGYARP
jgi:hypothetical protein